MLLSIIVYTLTGACLFFLGWHVNQREQQSLLKNGNKLPFYSWEIVASIVLFSIVAGARYHTGYDHAMYLDQYLYLQKTGEFARTNFEYGFEWISKVFAYFKIHYFFYFAFWAMLQIGFLYYGLRNHKHLLCWVGLGIMCGSFFLGWMNSVRQSVVVCLFVALIPLIKERKFLPYALIVIVAAFIHKSALMLIPVFLITYVVPCNKKVNRWVLLGIFFVFVIVGAYPFWTKYFTNYQWFLNLTGYENYANLNDPNVKGTLRMVNWGPVRLTLFLSNICMIWFYPEMKKLFKDDFLFPYVFILGYIGMCLSNLLINTTHFIMRPVDYFTIFYLILDAYIIYYLLAVKKKIFAFVFMILVFSHIYINICKAIVNPTITNLPFLYQTFLF